MSDKKKIFIGSSAGQTSLGAMLDVADCLVTNGFEPHPWNIASTLIAGEFTLENLVKVATEVDGAVLIFGDDVTTWVKTSAGIQQGKSARPNVFLEYGLFVGLLGIKNIGPCKIGDPVLPSDMAGINYIDLNAEFGWQKRLRAWANALEPKVKLPQGPPLPVELEKLRRFWEDRVTEADKVPEPGEPFKTYTFFGIEEEATSQRTIEDWILRMEMVYYQWADSRSESSITTEWINDDGWQLRVSFANELFGDPKKNVPHPTNFAIRLEGRDPVLPKQGTSIKSLKFDARIHPDDPGNPNPPKDDLQLAIRVVDALQTHWECLSSIGGHKCFPLKASAGDEWTSFAIPLTTSGKRNFRWRVFESDGNWLYNSKRPDFSTVLALVIEVGTLQGEGNRPGPGKGIIDFKNFTYE